MKAVVLISRVSMYALLLMLTVVLVTEPLHIAAAHHNNADSKKVLSFTLSDRFHHVQLHVDIA
jgi:hypothetical protein